jgi:hypothetical protein
MVLVARVNGLFDDASSQTSRAAFLRPVIVTSRSSYRERLTGRRFLKGDRLVLRETAPTLAEYQKRIDQSELAFMQEDDVIERIVWFEFEWRLDVAKALSRAPICTSGGSANAVERSVPTSTASSRRGGRASSNREQCALLRVIDMGHIRKDSKSWLAFSSERQSQQLSKLHQVRRIERRQGISDRSQWRLKAPSRNLPGERQARNDLVQQVEIARLG